MMCFLSPERDYFPVLFQDPVDLGWRPYVKTWLQKLPREMPDSGRQHLQQLFDFAIEKGLKFIRKHSRFLMMEVPEMCYIMTLCNIMSSFLDFLSKHGGFGAPGKFFFSLCLIEFRVNRQQANFYSDVTLREAIRKHVSKNTYSDL